MTWNVHGEVMVTAEPMGQCGPSPGRPRTCPGRMSRTSQLIDFKRIYSIRPGRPGHRARIHVCVRRRRQVRACADVRVFARDVFTWPSGRKLKRIMESITCDVRGDVRDMGVPDGLAPAPSNIRNQMPVLAEYLQVLASQLGREHVDLMVRASVDMRQAFDRDDYAGVREVYRRGHGWIDATESGYCLGVPAEFMRQFARRHREARHGTH